MSATHLMNKELSTAIELLSKPVVTGKQGNIVAIVGAAGSGKTTLIDGIVKHFGSATRKISIELCSTGLPRSEQWALKRFRTSILVLCEHENLFDDWSTIHPSFFHFNRHVVFQAYSTDKKYIEQYRVDVIQM